MSTAKEQKPPQTLSAGLSSVSPQVVPSYLPVGIFQVQPLETAATRLCVRSLSNSRGSGEDLPRMEGGCLLQ